MNNTSGGRSKAFSRRHGPTAARLLIAGAGVIALALGIAQGGYQDTLAKAVRICLECVGIG